SVKRPASGRAALERRTLARLSISRAGAHHRRAQSHRWRRPNEPDVRGFAFCRSHGKAIRRIYDSIQAIMSFNDSIERQSTRKSTRRRDSGPDRVPDSTEYLATLPVQRYTWNRERPQKETASQSVSNLLSR